ncbi:MAG: hypothetical protein J0647_05535, partial [Campylobacteraceae bacterium]|nr:hypothetical protein [Campylobacteraceae bacterium]
NLRIFETGIGIISFHIKNDTYCDIKSVLEINDYGRRIYPEYLDAKNQCSLVPDYISINGVSETFNYEVAPTEIELSKIIQYLIPVEKITPSIDDRMFVISYFKNQELIEELKKNYKTNDAWYEYIFIDGDGKTIHNNEMQEVLTSKATYPRWQQKGTLYGTSRYSFVCLSDNDFSLIHMKTIYFQMFSLLLMVRATVLKFSGEVSQIAREIDIDSTKVGEIYQEYVQFINNFYFREITSREQGIEMKRL